MSSNKRADILDAALTLFAERGYDGTTVPAIAEKAKVGAGTIYRYFENKEIVVNSLFQECVEQLANTLLRNEPASDASIRERFKHFVIQLTEYARENDRVLTFIDAHSNGLFLDEQSRQKFEQFLNVFRDVLDEGKRQKLICPLPSDVLIAMVYGAMVKVIHLFKKGVVPQSPELLANVEECCWNAICVH